MPASGKRLDLRFGAFACSVQGFDDPVPPVQQILRAIQHLLEESPELSETAINFDAEAIEQLIGEVARRADLDEREVEIVPGLVIIHHGGGAGPGRDAEADAAPWSAAFGADVGTDASEPWRESAAPGDGAAGDGYVNIFPPAGGDAAEGEEAGGETGADAEAEGMVARLRRMADAGETGDGWDAVDDTDDDDAAAGGTAAERPVNVFAGASDAGEAAAASRNLFTTDDADDDAGDAGDWQRALGFAGAGSQEGTDPDQGADGSEADEAGDGYTAAVLAERAGANAVPEMIVSAAAWLVLIKGQTQFTRRDVLEVFDAIPGEHERTLESRIKGFGKAVRNGHLVLIEEGVFGISRSDLEYFQKLL